MLLVVDNEVDPAYDYLPAALRAMLPAHGVRRVGRRGTDAVDDDTDGDDTVDAGTGLDDIVVGDLDAVVLTGSTAGVYDADDHPWMAEERRFVRRLVDAGVPTLGVCFGHQLVNDALGGTVEHRGLTAELVAVDFTDDPLFDGVAATVPMVHGDHVVDPGEAMESVASADYYPHLATRHRDAPVWTVQYHPEFGADLRERVAADFEWHETGRSFADATHDRTVRNFLRLAGARHLDRDG
ncbi:type 1 glutamine amidotransferase [Halobium salinum]|uniref:Type 1 glutamine amidotransferase n=1 Tax=Halobium salinum TaxID=1364940 RepID=A0ABD5PC41_9EURY|nr:type 1 glutamine amidotransferase [Halobium salinum]